MLQLKHNFFFYYKGVGHGTLLCAKGEGGRNHEIDSKCKATRGGGVTLLGFKFLKTRPESDMKIRTQQQIFGLDGFPHFARSG